MNAYLSKSNPQLVNDRAISVARYISASFLVSAVVDKEKVDLNNILDKARKLAVGKHGDGNSDSSDDEEEAGEECKEAQLIQVCTATFDYNIVAFIIAYKRSYTST